MSQTTTVVLFLCFSLSSLAGTKQEYSHCLDREKLYFNCLTRNQKTISLCGSGDLTNEDSHLQYRFGRKQKIELSYPTTKSKTVRKFFFSEIGMGDLVETVSFATGNYLYEVVVVLESDTKTGKRKPGFSGVKVSKNGNLISTFKCTEFPGWGFDAELIKVLPRRGSK